MKRNVLLLIDGDADTCAATLGAADVLKLEVRFARIARDVSELTQFALDDVAVIVLDYDPDVHGLSIAETFRQWSTPRPLVFVSSDESSHHALLLAGSTAKHLIKPVSSSRLAHAIGQLVEHDPECLCPSCDRWGHPYDERNGTSKHKPEKIAA